jgi:hypothetical protein
LNMLCLIIFFKHLSAKAAWINHHELRVCECQWKPNVWSYRENTTQKWFGISTWRPNRVFDAARHSPCERKMCQRIQKVLRDVESIKLPFVSICWCQSSHLFLFHPVPMKQKKRQIPPARLARLGAARRFQEDALRRNVAGCSSHKLLK